METLLSSLLSTLATTLLVVSPAVFVFSITLLGTAIEQSKQEEKAARENDKTTLEKEIEEIQKSLQAVKADGDTTHLTDKLEHLKNKRIQSEKKLKQIKIKYSAISLSNTVLYPCASYILCVLFSSLTPSLLLKRDMLIVLLCQAILFIYGTTKLCKSLFLVQQISADKRESESYSLLRDSIKTALSEHEQGKREEVSIKFHSNEFPLNASISKELNITFSVALIRGSVLKDAAMFFFVPDGFGLIDPPEDKAWRQPLDFSIPRARTVKLPLGNISVGTSIRDTTLKITTPANPGKYVLKYRLHAEAYAGTITEVTILVS
jgi:hypothetical protein